MKHTENKYWVNGYQLRGKNHKCLTFNIFSIGVLLSNNPSINIFILD